MPTVVDLNEQELAELKELTNQADAAAAVRTATAEYVRYARRMRLKALSGRVVMEDNWAEQEQAELGADDRASGPGAG